MVNLSLVKRIVAAVSTLGPMKTPTPPTDGPQTCHFTLERVGDRPDLTSELARIANLTDVERRKAYVILVNAVIDLTLEELIQITTAMRELTEPETVNRVVRMFYSEHREALDPKGAILVARTAGTNEERHRILQDFTRYRVEALGPLELIQLASAAEASEERDKILSIYNTQNPRFNSLAETIAIAETASDPNVRDEIIWSYANRFPEKIKPADVVRLARATIHADSHNAVLVLLIEKVPSLSLDDALTIAGATKSFEANDEALEAYLNRCLVENLPLSADQACALANKAFQTDTKDLILVRYASHRKSSLTAGQRKALTYHVGSTDAKEEIEALD